MSAGERVTSAQKNAARASGLLVGMVVKKKISRELLEAAKALLEAASNDITLALTPQSGDGTVKNSPSDEGEDHGPTD